MEKWYKIRGFNRYEVSNMGRIRSTSYRTIRSNGRPYTHNAKVLAQYPDVDGYAIVALYVGGKRYAKRVHRLVYEAINGEVNGCLVIDHINNNRQDNRIENLQAITSAQNVAKDKWRYKQSLLPLGVSRQTNTNKFSANYNVGGKQFFLGSYETIERASDAYWKARLAFENNGTVPSNYVQKRNMPKDGKKVCPCCGRELPLSEYYESRGRRQGKCKRCFKEEQKRYRQELKNRSL